MVFIQKALTRRNGIEARRPAEPGNGMEAREPARREREALPRSMFLDGLDRIVRTARLETAGGREQRGNEMAIEADRCDQRPRGEPAQVGRGWRQRVSPARPSSPGARPTAPTKAATEQS